MSNTVISKAIVENVVDPERNGGFSASITSLGGTIRPVTYVSPYGSNSEGAFIAIPEKGTEILVCKPDENSGGYFLGDKFAPEPGKVEGASNSRRQAGRTRRARPAHTCADPEESPCKWQ